MKLEQTQQRDGQTTGSHWHTTFVGRIVAAGDQGQDSGPGGGRMFTLDALPPYVYLPLVTGWSSNNGCKRRGGQDRVCVNVSKWKL